MIGKLPKAYEVALRQATDCLTGKEPFPVDVLHICDRLGVTLERSDEIPARRARIVYSNGKPSILLGPGRFSESIELTDWERFLVSHELGHLILYKDYNAKPLGESEYWKHEQLCDSFAQWWLIPAHKACEAATNSGHSAIARLNASCKLERDAGVPWPVAASAISTVDHDVAFFKVADLDRSHLRVRFSTLSNKKGIHRKVDRTSSAGKSLLAVRSQTSTQEVDSAIIREILWTEAQSCAAVRTGDFEIRVAAITSSATP